MNNLPDGFVVEEEDKIPEGFEVEKKSELIPDGFVVEQSVESVKTDQTVPAPQPHKNVMSWDIQKALMNQGVDPSTMQVVDPTSQWGFFKKMVRSFHAGDYQMKMDWRMAQAAASDTDIYAQYKADEDVYRKATAINPIEGDNFFSKAFYGAASSAAGMAYSMSGKIAGSVVGLGVATGIAALTPIPGDEVAVGAAFMARLFGKAVVSHGAKALGVTALEGTGAFVGGAAPYYLQGKGSLYRDMREMGVDHERAKQWASIGAAPYAAVEFINDYLPTKKIVPGMSKMLHLPTILKQSKPVISKSISQAVVKMATKWGISTASEASEEFWQEVNNESFKNIAASLQGVEATPVSDVFKRGFDAMVQAIGPSMILGLPTAAGHGIRQAKISKTFNSMVDMGVDENTARYVTASLTGSELGEINKLKTNDQLEFTEKVAKIAEKRIGVTAVNEIRYDNPEMSDNDMLKILVSPAPRAAYLAWQHEGIAGVEKINNSAELKTPQSIIMSELVGNTEVNAADKIKIITAPNVLTAWQEYQQKQKQTVSPDAETPAAPTATETATPDTTVAQPVPAAAPAAAPAPAPSEEPAAPTVTPAPVVTPVAAVAPASAPATTAPAPVQAEAKVATPIEPVLRPAVAPQPVAGATIAAKPTSVAAQKPMALKAIPSPTGVFPAEPVTGGYVDRKPAGSKIASSDDVIEGDKINVDGSELIVFSKIPGGSSIVASSPDTDQKVEVNLEASNVTLTELAKHDRVARLSDESKVALNEIFKEAPDVVETVKSVINNFNIAPASIGKVKKSVLVNAVKSIEKETGRIISPEELINNVEGFLSAITKNESIMSLAKNASPFTVGHEMFHHMVSMLMSIPEYSNAVDQWFDLLESSKATGKTQNVFEQWRKSKLQLTGEPDTFANMRLKEIAEWRKQRDIARKNGNATPVVLSRGLEEMLARMLEVAMASQSVKYTKQGTVAKESQARGGMRKMFDSLPEGLRNVLMQIADMFALMWRHVNEARGIEQQLYQHKALPFLQETAIYNAMRRLVGYDKFMAGQMSTVNKINEAIRPRIDKLRQQLIDAYSELDARNLLPGAERAISTPEMQDNLRAAGYEVNTEGYIRWMADSSSAIIRTMAINTALMKVKAQQEKVIATAIENVIKTAEITEIDKSGNESKKSVLYDFIVRLEGMFPQKKDQLIVDKNLLVGVAEHWSDVAIPYYSKKLAAKWWNSYGGSNTDVNAEQFSQWCIAEMKEILLPVSALRLFRSKSFDAIPAQYFERNTEGSSVRVNQKQGKGKTITAEEYTKTYKPLSTISYLFDVIAGNKAVPIVDEKTVSVIDEKKILSPIEFAARVIGGNEIAIEEAKEMLGEKARNEFIASMKSEFKTILSTMKEGFRVNAVDSFKILLRKFNDALDELDDGQEKFSGAETVSDEAKKKEHAISGKIDLLVPAIAGSFAKAISAGVDLTYTSITTEDNYVVGREWMKGKSAEEIIDTIMDSGLTYAQRIAVLITLSERSGTKLGAESSRAIIEMIASVGADSSRGLGMMKELYENSELGREILVDSTLKIPEKEKRRLIKDFSDRVKRGDITKIEKDYVEEQGESGFTDIVDGAIKDIASPAEPGYISNIMLKFAQELTPKTISSMHKKSKGESSIFFSGLEKIKQSAVDATSFAVHAFNGLLSNDLLNLSLSKHKDIFIKIKAAFIEKHAGVWAEAPQADKEAASRMIDAAIMEHRAGIISSMAEFMNTITANTDQDIDNASNEVSELNQLSSRLVGLIKRHATPQTAEVVPANEKQQAQRIISALMDVIKTRALVKEGKKSPSMREQFEASEFLKSIAENAELAQEIWADAQMQVSEMEDLAPHAQEFIAALMGNLFPERRVRNAMSIYLQHANESDIPAMFKNMDGVTNNRLHNISQLFVGKMIDENPDVTFNEAHINEAIDQIANGFADDMSGMCNMTDTLRDFLVSAARDSLRELLPQQVKLETDAIIEGKKLTDKIISSVAGEKIKPKTAEGNASAVMLKGLHLVGIIDTPSKKKNITDTMEALGVQANLADVTKELISETIKGLTDSIAGTYDLNVPESLKNMRGELTSVLVAIKESRKLREFMRNPYLQSTMDKAINDIMSMSAKSSSTGSLTMRKMVYNSYIITGKYIESQRKIVVDNLVNSGVPEPLAIRMADAIDKRFNERFVKARKHELEAVLGRPQDSRRPANDMMERILQRIHLGALETPETAKLMSSFMGLDGISEELRNHFSNLSRNIERRGNEVNHGVDIIAGSKEDYWFHSMERREMLRDFYHEINKVKGYSKMEKFSSWYFSLLLSGLSTPEVNTISTGLQAFTHTASRAFAVHMLDSGLNGRKFDITGFIHTMNQFFKGMGSSIMIDFPSVMKTNVAWGPSISEMSLMKHRLISEENPFKVGWMHKVGKVLRLAGRSLSAMDTVMANASYQAQQAMIARSEAVKAGLTGTDVEIAETAILATRLHRTSRYDLSTAQGVKELKSFVNTMHDKMSAVKYIDMIDNTNAHAVQAFYEATGSSEYSADAVKKMSAVDRMKFYRRIDEIQYNLLSADEQQMLARNAGHATFNFGKDPLYDNTWIGMMTNWIMEGRQKMPATQFIMPFVRIVGHVVNQSLDYSVVGLKRAQYMAANMLDEDSKQQFTQMDIDTMKTKAYLGMTMFMGIAAAGLASMLKDDDDDDNFQITSKGSEDRNKVNMLRESRGYGFQESSIRIGKTWYSYKYTPLVVPLTILGSIMDILRYDIGVRKYKNASLSEKEVLGLTPMRYLTSVTNGMIRSLPALFEQTYMNSLSEFMEILSTPNEAVRRTKVSSLFARLSTGFIVPNFVKQLNRSVDPSLYEIPENVPTILGAIMRELPMPAAWKNNVLLARYNVLGEPIRLTSPSAISSLFEITLREDKNKPSNIGRFTSTGLRSDPVWTWLAKNDVRLSSVSTSEQLLGIPMTDTIRQQYIIYRGRMMKNILVHMNKSGMLDRMNPSQAQNFVSKILPRVGSTIKAAMLADPSIVRELAAARRPEIWEKYGVTLPQD
jgi:hypothetical protein